MISVKSLIYNLDFKLNNLTNLEHQEIPVENKIIALNLGQLRLVKLRNSQNNNLELGFDANIKRYHDLQNLVVSHQNKDYFPEKIDEVLNKWIVKNEDISPKLMFFISGYAMAKKEDCKLPITLNEQLVKHRDLSVILNNSNEKPSFEYQETPVTISGNTIEIYDDGTFEYEKLNISYLKYPQKIDIEGYIDIEGNPSKTQDCELEDYLEDELLNLTIEEILSIQKDQQSLQQAMYRIKNQE